MRRLAVATGVLTLFASLAPLVAVVATAGGSLTLRLADAAVRHGDASTTVTIALALAGPLLLAAGLGLRRRVPYTAGAACLVALIATTVARLPNLVTTTVAAYAVATVAIALVSVAAASWPADR